VTDINKSKMRDKATGNFITQGLFLEHQYDTSRAVFTLKDQDYEYEGVIYPSLKRLYMEMEDLGEYEFASAVLLGWRHWQRICNNKLFTDMIEEWRLELEIKLRGRAIAAVAKDAESSSRSAISSAKWMADRKWASRGAGRPSKDEVDHNARVASGIADEYAADVVRIHGDK
jgi:hypothetical protein